MRKRKWMVAGTDKEIEREEIGEKENADIKISDSSYMKKIERKKNKRRTVKKKV